MASPTQYSASAFCRLQSMQITLENDRENPSVIKHYIGMSMNQMRHLEIERIIAEHKVVTLIDFGCSEGSLLQKLGRSETMQLLVGVDVDESAVSCASLNTYPENIQQSIQFSREVDQHIYIYLGDVTKKYRELKEKNVQLVTMVELIEHLPAEDIPKAMDNIFAYLQPELCFISTPNKEFNDYFEFQEGQMRHWDHKFEWTREQFKQFCESVQTKYGYSFTLGGIGEHITESAKGHCTQYALFSRPEAFESHKTAEEGVEKEGELQEKAHYLNKSWRNSKEKIMRGLLFKSLFYKEDITFQDAIDFLQKEQIGICFKNDGETVTKELILSYLQQNANDFIWDEQKYQTKRTYESSIEQSAISEKLQEQQFSHSFSESFQNDLSVSTSEPIAKREATHEKE